MAKCGCYRRTLQQDYAPLHTARNTIAYTRGAWECLLHWTGHVPPNIPDLNPMDYTIWGLCSSESTTRKFDTVDQTGDRPGMARTAIGYSTWLTTASTNGDIVYNVLWIRMTECRTHWTHISLTVCSVYCKIIVVKKRRWVEILSSVVHDLCCKQSEVFLVVYMCQKSFNSLHACYKQKSWKLVPLNLAHPVDQIKSVIFI